MMAQEGVTMRRSTTLKLEEVPPTWPGCTGSIKQKQSCFANKLANHVVRNTKFPKNYQRGSKVVVDMVITTKGKPDVKSITGGNKALQDAVRTAVMSMPEVKPGNVGGKIKETKFKLPFQF